MQGEMNPTVDHTIVLNKENIGASISPMLYGLFFEDINFAGDGGIYGEYIKNRGFNYFDIEGIADKRFAGWSLSSGRGQLKAEIGTVSPLNTVTSNYLSIVNDPSSTTQESELSGSKTIGILNHGFNENGFSIKKSERYAFSLYGRYRSGSGKLGVELLDSVTYEVIGEGQITINHSDWAFYPLEIKGKSTCAHSILRLRPLDTMAVDITFVSLFPKDVYKNEPNGLRKDLAELLEAIEPKFVRFPGGCIVEGRSFDNMYRWKDTIGDVTKRKLNWNRWQLDEYQQPGQTSKDYYQSYGLGFYEYFRFCSDIGAEPVPVLNVGLTCQFHEGEAVAMDRLDDWIQDALDLIEFANGDASTYWGQQRIACGHEAPFNLKYMGIGNEQWDEIYFERYEAFHKVLKERHQEIQLITSTGPNPSGGRFDRAMEWMASTDCKADIVDEHYYRSPEWFMENIHRYDDYDRKLPKVFAGEYAAHTPGKVYERLNNWEAALAEAAFLTGIENNSDHVVMSCYAPLFGKTGYYQWAPNLIWFNNDSAYGTPSYYIQKLFANHMGQTLLTKSQESKKDAVPLYTTVSVTDNGEYLIKWVNNHPKKQSVHIRILESEDGVVSRISGTYASIRGNQPEDMNSYDEPTKVSIDTIEISCDGSEFEYVVGPYEVGVMKLTGR